MDKARGDLVGKTSGWRPGSASANAGLLINFDGKLEFIEDQSVIAVTESRVSDEGPDKVYTILILAKDGPAPEACHFQAVKVTGLYDSYVDTHYIGLPSHLQVSRAGESLDRQLLVHVVISTRSGTGLAEEFFENAVQPLLAILGLSGHYEVHKTTSERTITDLAESNLLPQAKSGIHQTIILLSGDGAIADLVNVFHSAYLSNDGESSFVKPTIGLIPMGTGNALANSAGINSDGTNGLRHLLRGSPHGIPSFKATFSPGSELLVDEGREVAPLPRDPDTGNGTLYGAVVCSWGLHASLVADSDTTEYRKHGSKRFAMAANEILSPSDGSSSHVYKGVVTPIGDNDKTMKPLAEHEHMYILATMVSNLEQKLNISPLSRPLDGQMRLLHFGPMSAERVMDIMGRASTDGTHIDDPAVKYQPITGLRIDFEEPDAHWRRVCVDGKIVSVGEGGWVEVRMAEERRLDLLVME